MRRRKDAAVIVVVVVRLLAVVGEGAAAHLTARDAASVGERREEQRVDGGHLAKIVEYPVGPFVDERDGAHLDADQQRLGLRRG
jgi:hypothetical protein